MSREDCARAAALRDRLAHIVGAEHARLADDTDAVDGIAPPAVVAPANVEQAQEIVRLARADRLALIPTGAGTKLFLGNPPARCEALLSTARLNAVTDYDFDNLTLTAGAGATLAQLKPLLAERRQFIAVDGPFADRATLGGVAATNSTGPKRYHYKAPRDFIVGVNCVLGHGDYIKAGGKVVKNVSGFDLNKMLVGSYGTLGLITELTIRVQPMPECEQVVITPHATLADAADFARRVLDSFLVPSAVLLLDARAAMRLLALQSPFVSLVSFEGIEVAVRKQVETLLRWTKDGSAREPSLAESLWRGVNDFAYSDTGALSWRLGAPIAESPRWLARAREVAATHGVALAALAHYGTGLVFGECSGDAAACANAARALRARAVAAGGHLILLRAAPETKRRLGVWEPTRSDFALMEGIKRVYDPDGVFSPGRFVGGI